ncbi:uncharacterized protein PRCAT00002290001 [Priceomyces carsonii]|uniref:uncharacterized protein n=1 Tax=Priceomyces carsonii TaxID=28549 RepID=UPI002ED9D61A|nr:unnamed protein product [Priceomyces carsonii]
MPRLQSSSNVYLDTPDQHATNWNSRMNTNIKARVDAVNELGRSTLEWYHQQSKIRKIIIIFLITIGFVFFILVLIFHNRLIKQLVVISDKLEKLRYGRLLLFSLVFIVGFPPLIGFTPLSMLTGMVYGFPNGWFLLASASISGSLCSFIVFRYILQEQARKFMNYHEMFRAFAEILRDDSSLFLLILIRLCPLPYSLSNGALAAIPELPTLTYLLASVITSPKFLIHIFVGYKLKELGDISKSKSTKIIDMLSIIMAGVAASLTTYFIYNKMKRKLRSYHSSNGPNQERYEQMIFGNFDDDLESGNNVELNSADYDVDNFIIEDDGDILNPDESSPPSHSPDKMSTDPVDPSSKKNSSLA